MKNLLDVLRGFSILVYNFKPDYWAVLYSGSKGVADINNISDHISLQASDYNDQHDINWN